MNLSTTFSVLLALVLIPTMTAAQSEPVTPIPATTQLPQYKLKPDNSFLGMQFEARGGNAVSVIPFDKSYELLTPAQQARVKSMYESMGAGDEPPFPVGGLGALYDPLTKGHQRLLVEGPFIAEVMVNSKGEGISIAVLKTPSERVTKFVAGVALLTNYKPGLCKGAPCEMAFPIRMQLKVE